MASKPDGDIEGIPSGSDTYFSVVAAIDIGTSNSGYAYGIKDSLAVDPKSVQLHRWQVGSASAASDKAPTCVLFNRDSEFDSFGYKAEEKYARLCATRKQTGWRFFEKFKMALYTSEKISRDQTLHDTDNNPMPALRVFSAVIAYMKKQILEDVTRHLPNVTNDDVLYVLTVPAVWSDAAKQFMREAATSPEVGISNEQLKLVLEPEAASVLCRLTPAGRVMEADKGFGSQQLPIGYKYSIVDLGGGTADIATHEVIEDGRLHEILNARGDDLGGQKFNKQFLVFLNNIFGSASIRTWKERKPSQYLKLQRTIEGIKWDVSSNNDDAIFEVPQSLSDIVRDTTGKSVEELVKENGSRYSLEYLGDTEILLPNATVKAFFKDILSGVIGHLNDVVTQSPDLQSIFLVGGLAKSAYIYDHLSKQFPSVNLVVPEDPGVAVVRGAVLLGEHPQTIAGRIARFSYGIGVSLFFQEGVHKEEYKFTGDGVEMCDYLFEKLIEKGKILKFGDRFKTNTIFYAELPETKKQIINFYLYKSTEPSPMYYVEEGCTKVGGINVIPPDGGWPDVCEFTVELIVGEAELKFNVTDDLCRNYKCSIDFLLPDKK